MKFWRTFESRDRVRWVWLGARWRGISDWLQQRTPAPPMAVNLLPREAARVTDAQAGDSRTNPRRDDYPEEVPQAPHESAALQLRRKQAPRQRCRSDKPREKSEISSDIHNRRAAKVVELGNHSALPREGTA